MKRSQDKSPCARRTLATALVVALAAFTLASAVIAASPAPAPAGTMFNLVGRGFGHGIGLSAWGAFGYATKTDLTYKQILKHYYRGIGFGKAGNPTVRVLLNRGLSKVEISCTAQYTLTNNKRTETIPGGTRVHIKWIASRKLYRVEWADTVIRMGGPITVKPGTEQLQFHQPNQNSGSAHMHYRGDLWVRHFDPGLMVVNKLPLESYLRGVLPCEVPASWPRTALRTFAVACRTYGLRSRKSSGYFDVYCTTSSQVYNGFDRERATTNQALADTVGEIAKYGGRPILACYSSTSGGHTESIQYAWPGASPVPYLRGVSDPYERQDPTYANGSPYHVWQENPIRMSAATVAGKLRGYVAGGLKTVYVTRRGTSPRIVYAYVVGTSGSRRIDGLQIRSLLGLRSSWVQITTMSVSASRGRVATGNRVRIYGRVYPARASGATVKLHIKTASGTRTVSVRALKHSQALPNGLTAHYSTYSCTLRPNTATTYWYSSSGSISPKVAVRTY